MSKSLPGNVFATSSKEAIDLFLKISDSKVKLVDFLGKLSDEQLKRSVICSPSHNENLIDFEMDWNAQRKGHTTRFRFVETGSFFELQYINKDLASEKLAEVLFKTSTTNKQNKLDLEGDAVELINNPADSRNIYFAFGVGDDLSNWAGPFVGNLISSEVVFTESGMREIVLEFVTNEGKFLRDEIEGPNSKNVYRFLDKYDNIYKNKAIRIQKIDYIFLQDIKTKKLHNKIRSLIELYIMSCISTDKQNYNVVVLLPDLTRLMSKYYNEPNNKKYLDETNDYSSFFNKLGLKSVNKFLNPTEIESLKEAIEERKTQLKDITENNKQDLRGKSLLAWFQSNETNKMFDDSKNFIQRNLDVIQKDYQEKQKEKFFEVSIVLDSKEKAVPTETTPNYYYPLDKFNIGLSQMCRDLNAYNYNPVFSVESDLRIINLWNQELFKNTLDLNKPVFIFGDRDIISELLYVSQHVSISTVQDLVTNKEFISADDYRDYFDGKSNFRNLMFLMKRKNVNTHSFQDRKKQNDDLTLDEESFLGDSAKQMIKILECPVFRHNISNPNVLSLTVQNLPSFLDVYNTGYQQKSIIPFISDSKLLGKYSTIAQLPELQDKPIQTGGKTLYDLVLEQSEKDPQISKDINKLFNFIVSIGDEDGNTKLKRRLADKGPVNISIIDENKNVKTVSIDLSNNKLAAIFTIEIFKKFNNNIAPTMEFLKDQEIAAYERSLFNMLCSKVQNVTIKTLPWFSINGNPVDLPCALIGLQNLIGQNSDRKQKAIYTGLYLIKGYRHVISPTEMYSEFLLYRKPYDQIMEK